MAMDCDQQLLDSDECLKKLVYFTDWNLTFVQNEQDMVHHCKLVKETATCVRAYKKCLHGLPREMFNLVSQNSRQIISERCDSTEGRSQFLGHIRCLDDETNKLTGCLNKVIAMLQYTADKVDGDEKEILTASCCAAHYIFNCFVKGIDEDCKHKTGVEAGPYLAEKINQMIAGVFDVACKNYPSIEVCEAQHPDLMQHFHQLAGEGFERQKVSILVPLIKIAHKIKYE
ncbi:uncharacterized protein LOC107369984 isoform X2 [Tetranychus urticae]|nr:uncharacterized protein LOC107369984 isoform X2 [Tetranychus urticae]